MEMDWLLQQKLQDLYAEWAEYYHTEPHESNWDQFINDLTYKAA